MKKILILTANSELLNFDSTCIWQHQFLVERNETLQCQPFAAFTLVLCVNVLCSVYDFDWLRSSFHWSSTQSGYRANQTPLGSKHAKTPVILLWMIFLYIRRPTLECTFIRFAVNVHILLISLKIYDHLKLSTFSEI